MMRRWMVVWAATTVLALAGVANAKSNEGDLDRAGLKTEARNNRALARYIEMNGMPDVAEARRLVDQSPWENHEVSLYYLGQHKEISFARARILGSPDIQIRRYERTLTDADVKTLQGRAGKLGGAEGVDASSCTGSATARAECAATRAQNAAERVDLAATRAEQAADKTEAIVDKMAKRESPAPRRRAHAKRSSKAKVAKPKEPTDAKPQEPAAAVQPQEPAAGLDADKGPKG